MHTRMRIRVIDVLELLADDMTSEEISVQLLDLERDDIRASLAYAARYMDHPRLVAAG